MSKEYLKFESIIQEGTCRVEDVIKKDNMVYFTIDGRKFQTYGTHIIHENNPMFDSPPVKIFARNENEPESIVQQKEFNDKMNDEMDKWFKHKKSLYKIVLLRAMEMLTDEGNEEDNENRFIEYIDHHFFITEEGNNCQKLISMLDQQ